MIDSDRPSPMRRQLSQQAAHVPSAKSSFNVSPPASSRSQAQAEHSQVHPTRTELVATATPPSIPSSSVQGFNALPPTRPFIVGRIWSQPLRLSSPWPLLPFLAGRREFLCRPGNNETPSAKHPDINLCLSHPSSNGARRPAIATKPRVTSLDRRDLSSAAADGPFHAFSFTWRGHSCRRFFESTGVRLLMTDSQTR
ncbi:hypothetical protein DTO271G3_3048 [Paecilomyces variotii]|nr:hypothetical protein DTO271G3_3048 [Paecilomyces variotii]